MLIDPELMVRLGSDVERAFRRNGEFDRADMWRELIDAVLEEPCGPKHMLASYRYLTATRGRVFNSFNLRGAW